MRKVLIVAYYFPPQNYIGAHRPFRFARHLPKFGWKVSVVSSIGAERFRADYSLLKYLPDSVEVIRIPSEAEAPVFGDVPQNVISKSIRKAARTLSNWIFFPDRKVLWSIRVASLLPKLANRLKPDVIWITAPPFSAFVVGMVAQRLGISWVADFRDAWSPDVLELYTSLQQRIAQRLERKVLTEASVVTSVNKRIVEYQRRLAKRAKIELLHNGFDSELIPQAEWMRLNPKRFRISYIGNLVGKRDPHPLFACISKFLQMRPSAVANLEVTFVGKSSHDIEKIAKGYGLSGNLRLLDFTSYREAAKMGINSTVLWMIVSSLERSAELITPGKLFDYIGFMRPIIAHAPKGAVWDIIEELGDSFAFEDSDADGCALSLALLFDQFQRGRLYVNKNARMKFEIERLTERLASILQAFC